MSRKLKIRGLSLLITVVFIGTMVLLNIFTGMLTDRFFIKADLTATGLFTISESASEFLSGITETVDVVVLSEESAWMANPMFNMIINTLQNYSAEAGGRLHIQYVNPDLNYFNGPKYNNSLTNLRDAHSNLENMARNDIIFITDYRAVAVPASDVFVQSVSQGRSVVVAVRSDQVFVSALLQVLNETIPHAVFIENHGESSSEYMRFILERSGYKHSTINLALEDVPDDATVLFTNAPKFDFMNDEIVKIEQFLLSGGNVVVLYDFAVISLPILDAFLAEWGVIVENKLIFDEAHTYLPQYGIIGTHVVEGFLESTAYAEAYTRETMRVGAFLSRPLRSSWVGDAMSGFTLFPLIQTFSSSSYAKSLESGDGGAVTTEKEAGDETGPFVIAYHVLRQVRGADNERIPANLIVAGADMFEDSFLSAFSNSFYNSMFIADLASDFNPTGQNIFIPAKPLASNQMPVSSGNARAVLIIMVIMLPLVVFTAAGFVWYKRRHK